MDILDTLRLRYAQLQADKRRPTWNNIDSANPGSFGPSSDTTVEFVQTVAVGKTLPNRDGYTYPDYCRSGYEQDAAAGAGANLTLDIDAGSNRRSWTYLALLLDITGLDVVFSFPDVNVMVYAADAGEVITTRPFGVFRGAGGAPFDSTVAYFGGNIPKSRIQAIFENAVAGQTYYLVGIWREDR